MNRGSPPEHTRKTDTMFGASAIGGQDICSSGTDLNKIRPDSFGANTYPMNFAGVTGIPCRVIAEV